MSFIFGNIHAWDSNGKILVSNEDAKSLLAFATVDDAINWLFVAGHRDAARALNKQVKS